ncbi:hypothetical protein Moror_10399 [Moniliophthora roreri MCA 2997]|uniref:Uncharacterized protein n=1 Tax=Moniliophthora roreri (strain MCA 2997) TaxID=1381753 RepID=V2WYL5_MONRO|nr:hypothetical protein Moror_10399 [Moniliophthora roreri MCA 2997]
MLFRNGTSESLASSLSRVFISQSMMLASWRHIIYSLLVLLLCIIVIRPYFRHRFPCLTLSSLDEKERDLIRVCDRAPKVDGLSALLEPRLSLLKDRASEIRIKSRAMRATRWSVFKKYFGVVYDLVTWNDDAEALKLDVLIFIEKVSRDRYRAELSSQSTPSTTNQPSVPDSDEND